MSDAKLISDSGIEFRLKPDLITIGRPDQQGGWAPVIDLSSVDANRRSSRRHAEIRRSGAALTLRDLGSANKTFLNGQPLEPNKDYPLAEGDTLTFGGEARLRLEGLAGAKSLRCPKCDEAVTPDMPTCASCGASLSSSTMSIEIAPKHPCVRCGRPTRGEEHCSECEAAVAGADTELLALSGLKRKK